MINDYISELTKGLGEIYASVTDGIGSEVRPSTALFELQQLESLARNSLPAFGVLDTAAPSFAVTYDDSDPSFVSVGQGEIGLGTQRIAIPPRHVAVKRSFAHVYDSDYVYGVRIGLSYREAQKATEVFSTVTSSATSAFASELPIANTSIPESLGFPLSAHVGNLFVVFSGLNSDSTALVVDSAYDNGSSSDPFESSRYGTIAPIVLSGTAVRFIYEPKVQAVYGLPVQHVGTNPAAFDYYPPLPSSWIPIADILVGPPSEPVVLEQSPGVFAIERTVEAYPIPDSGDTVFPSGDDTIIARAVQSTRAALRQARNSASVGEVIAGLESYTARIANDSQISFNEYWASQPFRPTSFFARGVSFAGLERMEFSRDFVRAYYEMRGVDLQHTFAIFRGDLFDNSNIIYGSPPTTIEATSYLSTLFASNSSNASLVRGTYIYGVSAVTNDGETAVGYASTVASYSSKTFFVNHIEFSEVSGALFYHIYRRGNTVGDQTEYRLTEIGDVDGFGTQAIPDVTYDSNRQIISNYEATKFTAGGSRFIGFQIRMYSYGEITNTSDELSFALYTDSAGSPGSLVVSLGTVAYEDITPQARDFFLEGVASLTPDDDYWIVISRPVAPVGGQVRLVIGNDSVTGDYASATTIGSWTPLDNITVYARPLFGFIDSGLTGLLATKRGIRLTGRTALTPRRLRVYVPPMEDLDRGKIPLVDLTGDAAGLTASETETTFTMNELIVRVTARSGSSGVPTSFSITVPQGTVRGTEFLIGTDLDLFDRVDDVQVVPGAELRIGSDNKIAWSIYDTVTVETVP